MALYVYVKKKFGFNHKVVNYVSYFFLIGGVFLLFWSLYPIISFGLYSKIFIERKIVSPVPRTFLAKPIEEAGSVLGNQMVFSSNLRDFTNIKLWFPSSQSFSKKKNLHLKKYKLSIPKLNIEEALVVVGGEDLSRSLIHFYPQSLPGEYGNIVIFGHSTLPQLYNSTDYKTIFTHLPSLEKKDKVYLIVEKIKYEYEVFDMFVVDPEETSVLEQRNDSAYLTLVTCVPPGTYWKRLIVRAKLSSLPLE